MGDMAAYDYELPPEAIAQVPAEPRESARLLVALGDRRRTAPASPAAGPASRPAASPPADPAATPVDPSGDGLPDPGGEPRHRHVRDLPDLLGPGDVLVVNETRVRPSRLLLHKATGGRVEVLLLEPAGAPGEWQALVRPGRRVPAGTRLAVSPGSPPLVEVGAPTGRDDGSRLVRALGDLDGHAALALPPYITTELADPERYQTVYARTPGSVAAPTAGLHLSEAVLDRCRERGVDVRAVDLAVGLATFRPVSAAQAEDHVMHAERYDVPIGTLDACRAARRVVAVGTTTVRALESAAGTGRCSGETRLFIREGFPFRVVDVLLTNFHLPRSTLLLLLAAFAGPGWRRLYGTALAEGYRFLSFGDAMLVGRGAAP